MASELRQTGIDVVGDMPWGTHFCHFYQTRQDLEDIVIPYMNAGLDNHELCQFIIAAPLGPEERRILEQAIPRFNHHMKTGNLEILLYPRYFFENGNYRPQRAIDIWNTKLEELSAKGLSGLRVVVDGAWMEEKYLNSLFQLETEINPGFIEKKILILCAYPLSHVNASAIFDVMETHQFAIARQHGKWKVLEPPGLKQAKAEIQKLNEELEQKVIERTNELAKTNEELRLEIEERETAVAFLKLLNESKTTEELIRKSTDFISRKTGCDAVGIRLREKQDFPYYTTIGFSEEFVFLENNLCSRDENGRLLFDKNDNPVLECMCGAVINATFDPATPFFTPMGSFWTNSTTDLLSSTTEADRQMETRNRCNDEGYESVALIPLRLGEERFGLLQLNDKRKSFFTIKTIAMWERLANFFSMSISRIMAEEIMQQMNATLEQQVAERTKIAETRARQLQSLAVELVEAEEFERQRIADLLHNDLQQLIASARMQVQSASEKTDQDPILKNVDRLLGDSIEKSRRLSHELSPPVLHQFGLAAALEWLVRQMDEQFGLDVRLRIEMKHQIRETPLNVFLFRAAQELLFNSVKHSGVKRADLRLYDIDDAIALTVSDHGKGFDPGILESFTRKGGLGLVSLRERAAAIQGNLDIESAPGRGSRFTLTVPSSLAEIHEPEKVERAFIGPFERFEKHGRMADPEGIKVLFVDDHKVMRQGLISIIAEQPGIQVAGEAESGEDALELADQLKPDVIIMDISMPGMGGVEATRLVKARNPEIRVIGLSMFAEEGISRKMREAGADGFISKSESSSKLLKEIYEVAGRQ